MNMGGGTVYAGGWLQNLDLNKGEAERIEYVRTPVQDMALDQEGRVWVASSFAGVWEEDDGRWTHLTDSSGVVMRTSAIYADEDYIWVGSPDDGLQRLDPKTGQTRIYTEFDGISCQRIIDIAADASGGLWLATPRGVAFLNPENEETAFYSSQDGIDASQAEFSVLKNVDGMLYIGDYNHLICFDPIQFRKRNPGKRWIVFTGLSLPAQLGKNEKRPLREPLLDIDEKTAIKLKAQENTFLLGVSQMDYSIPRTSKLEFLLEGVSSPQWRPVDSGHITVTNLLPGRYKLKVREVGRGSGELIGIRELDITVAPPPQASPLALLLYILLLFAGFLLLMRKAQKRASRKASLEAEQREAESQKRLYASKVEFLTTIAHEIRTPLTLVMAPVETLQAKLAHSADKSVVEDLDIVGRNANKLSMLLDELLDFRKLENSGIKLTPAEYDINAIVRSTVGRFSLAANKKGIKLTLALPQETISAAVDKNAFDKIVTNLLSNGIKYGQHTVNMSLSASDGQIRLVMENDGPSVPLQDRERIFHPFERYVADGSIETGTGIGLFVSRNLAELHGGTLVMDNDTTMNRFLLSLPITHIVEEVLETNPLPEIHIPQERPTVLVVEDSQEMLEFIRRQCEMAYSVLTATNGEEALAVLKDNPLTVPDCIISDVMMPVMDGYQLCRQLKSDEKTAHIPLILLTALADTDSRMVGLSSGADAYLSKPFSPAELLSLIGSLLKNREILKKKYASLPAAQYQDLSPDSQDAKLLRTIDAFVQSHLAEESLSVETLAAEACISTSSLFKKLKHLVGMGPSEYILTARLKQAAALLRNSDLPVAEISARTGFRSASYFSSCFKGSFGITPKQYRNRD
ncbi:MAG: response regulator, partial [Bacteroidales bacterium]|nr:response regulator [Bacteroidales bacterium]